MFNQGRDTDAVRCNPLSGSQAQTFATFGAPPADDPAATDGRHTGTKSMGPHSLDFARLKCSFHSLFPLYIPYLPKFLLTAPGAKGV
jgi:hypothetical protein